MYKKVIRVLIVIGVVGLIAYKAYEYFVKKDDNELEDGFVEDFDEDDCQESIIDKIKTKVQSVLG